MKNLKNALNDLQLMVETGLESHDLPIVKGNSIRIKNLLIRKSSRGFVVVDTSKNKTLGITYSRIAALALTRAHLKEDRADEKIQQYDSVIEKHSNDCHFYEYHLSKAKNSIKYDIYSSRLDLSQDRINSAKRVLENYVMEPFN